MQIFICFILKVYGVHLTLLNTIKHFVSTLIIGKIIVGSQMYIILKPWRVLIEKQTNLLLITKRDVQTNLIVISVMDGKNMNIIHEFIRQSLVLMEWSVQKAKTVRITIHKKIEEWYHIMYKIRYFDKFQKTELSQIPLKSEVMKD